MTTIVIDLAEERLRKLHEVATRFGVSPEELARVSIEELLDRPDQAFNRVADLVLDKNDSLYQRLD